jgi:diguanylate cyclase (GGDEF)-like protein
MNRKTRELYAVNDVEEVRDQKCYELFQKCATPCAICTNKKLKVNQFVEWTYFNPILSRTFLLKDTMVVDQGRRLRVELALDVSRQEEQQEMIHEYIENEIMVNEALRLSLMADTPDRSLDIFLEYIGKSLKSERAYVFERLEEGNFSNTYEWCAMGVSAEKDHLQNIPFQDVSTWIERFHNNQHVLIKNLEDIRESDPVTYQYLRPQNIHSVVAAPLMDRNQIIGFYGVDNPPEKAMESISTLFPIIGHFIVSMLRRRSLVTSLETLSYFDQLTGCMNRHALIDYVEKLEPGASVGLVYGDVAGLKAVNDAQGHKAGDDLLVRAGDSLKRVFREYLQFRIGGDEFLALCSGITEEELQSKVEELKQELARQQVVMSLGCVWHDDGVHDLDRLLTEADEKMYEDKRNYYAQQGRKYS